MHRNLKGYVHMVCFSGGSGGKESACSAGDPGLIPGSGRSPGEGHATRSSFLAWRIPWTEEPGGPRGHKDSDTTERLTHMVSIHGRVTRFPRLFIFADLHFLVLLH